MINCEYQVVKELGPHRISSIVSDDTNATKKARRVVTSHYPAILNLADPVHKLNLCIQDICSDKIWTEVSELQVFASFKCINNMSIRR